MFERYTDKARRAIFFARYEASEFGSPYIETEHLLLGLLREDKVFVNRFLRSDSAIESIRKQIEANTSVRQKIGTSVDLPLSRECKRALTFSAEEADRLSHKSIDTLHLFLGLFREEKSFSAQLLRERGLRLDTVREQIQQSENPLSPRASVSIAGLDRWLAEREAREGFWSIKHESFEKGTSRYAVYAPDGGNEESRNRNAAEKLVEIQKRIRSIIDDLQHAIANHEFEKARFYSEEERRERENLRQLRDQFNSEGAVSPVPLLCLEITRDDRLADLQERCEGHIAEGVPEVWILEPKCKRAYTFTKDEGLREFKGEILRITNPPLEMDLKKIFD